MGSTGVHHSCGIVEWIVEGKRAKPGVDKETPRAAIPNKLALGFQAATNDL